MKIYPNDLCPCGSGKKFKKCCMNSKVKQTGMIGALPVDNVDKNADFIVNRKGAVVFKDESRQPVLEIPEGSITKTVLSVGVSNTLKPMATIQEKDGAICYILPDWYSDWCQTCVGMSMNGMNVFPSDVAFSFINGKYSADIL